MKPKLSICVYCGSRAGNNPAYAAAARELGQSIAQNGWRLVYGAGDVGLMGTVATSASANGADVLGVIPKHLVSREAPKGISGPRIVTETMHERKKVMFMNADAVAVLPGGAGSLDEFFEVLTWAQIGLHSKPIFLLNIDSYWTPLINLVDHLIEQGFADENLNSLFKSIGTVPELLKELTPQPT